MYLRKEKGYVLINLIYILMLISFFSTVLVTMIINGLKREKFDQYYSKDMKSYNLECEIEELDNYLIVNNTAINYLKNNSDDKVYIRENVFLKYDINKKVFILGNDENYTF
ncbi:hypothetical protein PMW03_17185, partial [Clostridium paraputrificum]